MAEYNIQESHKLLDDYTDALKIDKLALDNELTDHPELLNAIGREYARCMAMRDNKKHDHDLAIAATDKRLRTRYSDEGVKITEARLEKELLEHPAVQNAFTEYAMWKHMTEAWLALKESMNARGYALRDLAALYIAGYYSHAPVKAAEKDATLIRAQRG